MDLLFIIVAKSKMVDTTLRNVVDADESNGMRMQQRFRCVYRHDSAVRLKSQNKHQTMPKDDEMVSCEQLQRNVWIDSSQSKQRAHTPTVM